MHLFVQQGILCCSLTVRHPCTLSALDFMCYGVSYKSSLFFFLLLLILLLLLLWLVRSCSYPVVSDNPVVVHDGDDEARLSDLVQWDGEHEGFVEDGVQCRVVDGCLLLHFPSVVHRPHFHVGIHRYGRSLEREQKPSWRLLKWVMKRIKVL